MEICIKCHVDPVEFSVTFYQSANLRTERWCGGCVSKIDRFFRQRVVHIISIFKAEV